MDISQLSPWKMNYCSLSFDWEWNLNEDLETVKDVKQSTEQRRLTNGKMIIGVGGRDEVTVLSPLYVQNHVC